jgi:hypothetical protein
MGGHVNSHPVFLDRRAAQGRSSGNALARRRLAHSLADPQPPYLLQAFNREGQDTLLFVLTDGDAEGKNYLQRVEALCKRLDVPTQQLREGRSIEDYCLFEDEFLQAAIFALKNAFEAEGKKVPNDLADRGQKSWETRKAIPERPEKPPKADKDEKDERKTAGKWFNTLSKEVLEDDASKIVLATTYVERCRELKNPRPTHSQERMRKKKSARFVRNDGEAGRAD